MSGSPFRNVAVIGLGVMGGSLARALSAVDGGPRITGWSPEEGEGEAALSKGAIHDLTVGPHEAIAGSDLVVLATPLQAVTSLLHDIGRSTDSQATVIDVASLKVPVQGAAQAAGLRGTWVGCHPMCGSEASGFAASRADLYHDALVWVVADEAAEDPTRRVERLWSSLGARTRRVGAAEHDSLMALVSHLPQLTANALAKVLEGAGVQREDLGRGGLDMTRLAGSSVEMWHDLFEHAPAELPLALEALADHIQTLADAISSGDVDSVIEYMGQTRAWSTVA